MVLTTAGHIELTPEEQAGLTTYDAHADTQGFFWDAHTRRFSGGDCDKKYRITLPFDALTDKLGRAVPTDDCRKIYMVFAPRFERTEEELEDGCFLTAPVGESDTIWSADDTSRLTGGRYFVGDQSGEERVLLTQALPGQVNVLRGYEGTTPQAWPAGTRVSKLSPMSGFSSDVEWRAVLSNIAVTCDERLKVGGAAARIEETDARCKYTGYWEDYKYGAAGWPSQWWSGGHARRAAPSDASDVRKVVLTYSQTEQHDLYLGTFLNTDCGKITVEVDGVSSTHDLYLSEYGGTTANLKVRGNVAAGNHTVVITALFDRNAASSGYYFYFDYLWPLVPQDVPDAPQEYSNVSLAIDFDTDHGYKKPAAWHLWQLQKLGFKGHADVYMGVFWNNKRQRIGATYPYATVAFSGFPVPGDVVSISIGGTTITHAIGYGPLTVFPLSHHNEPFMPGEPTCSGGAYTFQIPGALAAQDEVAIPMKVHDLASLRCVFAYVQQPTTDGQSAYVVKISRDGGVTCEVLEKMGIAQKLPGGYKTTYDYLVDAGYGPPETRRLPYADYGLFSLNAITGSGTPQTIATASYDASTTGLEVGRFVFLEFGTEDEECVEVLAVDSEAQTFDAVVTKDHAAFSIRPCIWPTPILHEGKDLTFDIKVVASPNPGSDLTVVIQT